MKCKYNLPKVLKSEYFRITTKVIITVITFCDSRRQVSELRVPVAHRARDKLRSRMSSRRGLWQCNWSSRGW